MALPSVSIVLPTFNRLQFLPATIESVFNQTMPDWELVVVDDGSGPDVLAYLDALSGDARVRVLKFPHSGNPSSARNRGIAVAQAPYIAFLDSDDLWEPRKLERQLAQLRAEPDCGWCYTAFVVVDAEDRPFPSERTRPWTPHRGRIFAEVVRTAASIRTSSVVADATLVRNAGAFDEAIDCSVDYDLWMRLALRSPTCVVDEPLVRFRRHAENLRRPVSAPYVARDYYLRKLSTQVGGADRDLLAEERSHNALQLAAAIFTGGHRWGSVAAVAQGLPLGWKYPRWWYGSARALARACFARQQPRRDRFEAAGSS
jgi:glycosyltransferase involved in cell wall biosynthesis